MIWSTGGNSARMLSTSIRHGHKWERFSCEGIFARGGGFCFDLLKILSGNFKNILCFPLKTLRLFLDKSQNRYPSVKVYPKKECCGSFSSTFGISYRHILDNKIEMDDRKWWLKAEVSEETFRWESEFKWFGGNMHCWWMFTVLVVPIIFLT